VAFRYPGITTTSSLNGPGLRRNAAWRAYNYVGIVRQALFQIESATAMRCRRAWPDLPAVVGRVVLDPAQLGVADQGTGPEPDAARGEVAGRGDDDVADLERVSPMD